MIELLDNATKRRIKIVEYLIDYNDWLSASEISDQLDASQKTVSTDLHYISIEWKHFIKVENDTQKRYRAFLIVRSLKLLYRSILNHSESFNILESVFLNPTRSVSYWKKEFNFSEATLRRIIEKINERLKPKNVYMRLNPLALISENEIYVRLFMTRYLIEAFEPREWAIGSNSDRVARFIFLIYDYVLPESPYMFDESLPAMFFTSMIRYSQGFYLNETLTTIDDELFLEVSSFLKLQWENFQQIFENYPIQYSDALVYEICTIVFPFYKKHDESIQNDLNHVIELISKSFNAPISLEEKDLLIIHLERNIISYNSVHDEFALLFDYENSSLTTIKTTYSIFYQLAYKALESMDSISQSRSKNYLIDILIMILFTQWSKFTIYLENHKKKITILCLSRISSQHTNLLADMISIRFDSNVKVIPLFLDARNRYEEGAKLPYYDLAVSFYSVTTIPSDRLIICDIVPSNQDIKHIIQTVGRIRRYKLKDIPYLNEEKGLD